MSFSSRSSRSSNGNHYRKGDSGSNHYQKKGLFGKLFDVLGSGSGSGGNNRNQYHNTPMNNQHITNQNQPIVNKNSMCSKCNSQMPAGSKFCLQCGEKVNDVLFCMDCGEKLPPNAKFCLKCGKKINE